MARGYSQSGTEVSALPAATKRFLKSALTQVPSQGFPPDEDGDGATIQVGRLMDSIVDGYSSVGGQYYAGLRELILNLPKEQRKDAAGLVADVIELAYLKGIRQVRIDGAKQFEAADADKVANQIDNQIKSTIESIADGIAALPKEFSSTIITRTSFAISDSSNEGHKRRGEAINATNTVGFKKVLNSIYERLAEGDGASKVPTATAEQKTTFRDGPSERGTLRGEMRDGPGFRAARSGGIMPEREINVPSALEYNLLKREQQKDIELGKMGGPNMDRERNAKIFAYEESQRQNAAQAKAREERIASFKTAFDKGFKPKKNK